jgi:ATP-dependent DNA helicase RecQ
VLRDMAQARPRSLEELRTVKGVGDRKLADLGARFIEAISAYAQQRREATHRTTAIGNASKGLAFQLFAMGQSVDSVAAKTGRARGTVGQYLEDYVSERKPADVSAWVDDITYARVKSTAERTPGGFLKPVFEALGGSVSYEDIRVVMKHAGMR